MDIPYSCQCIDEEDIAAVSDALRSRLITSGPLVNQFESLFASYVDSTESVAVSSGTAALHAAMQAIDIGPGDEVIVPPITFVATANAVVYQGGTPIFADVDPGTLLIDPVEVEKKITGKTKAVITVDYAGQPCNYDSLKVIAGKYKLILVADACHSLGATYHGVKAGSIADMTVSSFHPVKHLTTGEGGMVSTNNPDYAKKIRVFRNHGISTDFQQREKKCSWCYEMVDLGYNYRITDFQCALGISQLSKSTRRLARRREIAAIYDEAFTGFPYVKPLSVSNDVLHAYHLYVVRIMDKEPSKKRESVFKHLREKGIGVNVHYLPVHLHPFYKKRFNTGAGLCPVAEQAYEHILSLPMFPELENKEQEYVIKTIKEIWS